MVSAFYYILFGMSVVLTLVYAAIWHKHYDVHLTLLFTLIPICSLGYVLFTQAHSLDEALLAYKIIYIGGCYLELFIMLSVFGLCYIKLSKFVYAALITLNTVIYLSVLTIGKYPLFYRNVSFIESDGGNIIIKEYGPMHTVFVSVTILYFILTLGATVYSYFKKKDVSRKIIYLLLFPEFISVFSYFGRSLISDKVELIPLSYVVAQIVYLLIIHRVSMYNITDTGIESLEKTGDTGFVSVDFKYNYLGSNDSAKAVFPELCELTVDKPISRNRFMCETAVKWLTDFREDEENDKFFYKKDGRTYQINVNYLYAGNHKRGYQFFVTDDTVDQQYISLLNVFNTKLKDEVARKTADIIEMHDQFILGMATMVESRDNSTGGHIKRTSDVVRILVEEIIKDGELKMDDTFWKNLVKSAPMHDLGKIAVDDAILRKPGRFTDEEFEKMKSHAAEGARIVSEILKGTSDDAFKVIAENVAHYHHERWDGSGYPNGLKGEDIPLEARIMAIADVYDALVSKRVYKESMSFEQADAIIMDGMGKHFDKSLEKYYVSARPKLEAYYSENV